MGEVTTSDGVTLRYLEAGSGAPLVMIPGWSQTAAQFKHQLEGLSDAKKASPPPAPKPEKKAATPKCRARSVLIDGKCILKSNAAAYCGPGYHLKGHKCVHGAYVAPKVRKKSVHRCPPGQVWSPQELCHYDD